MTRSRLVFALLLTLVLGACATTPPDPRLLDNARQAIDQAEAAGAQEYSPLELRFARERLQAAQLAMQERDFEQARRLADESEIDAQLALARTQAALTRAELADALRALDALKADLVEAFGEEVLQ
ncbi:DUF4398 domain-containing protein [Wenzhouxiangella marina]|uniref:Uncharacterized protein n=1 Tax=Wenzhouxiangella marina TaxID=1579979 RepID=A0A0K0XYF2_9GAMM|nr:DUF4398 domain-containing protein [Wenzhouxiangella marina]AKS42708.1 hypothetical protein WM2015_2345 [Wenzhouxiangella marina]MBB6088603.1 outer membrane PBP1 activator LpoA protein [Wenzhouxiangella marina]